MIFSLLIFQVIYKTIPVFPISSCFHVPACSPDIRKQTVRAYTKPRENERNKTTDSLSPRRILLLFPCIHLLPICSFNTQSVAVQKAFHPAHVLSEYCLCGVYSTAPRYVQIRMELHDPRERDISEIIVQRFQQQYRCPWNTLGHHSLPVSPSSSQLSSLCFPQLKKASHTTLRAHRSFPTACLQLAFACFLCALQSPVEFYKEY